MASSTLMCVFIVQATELRSIYYAVPGVSFLLFFFSGMLVKPSTLPRWCAPWMPSISTIRWYMQAGVINENDGNDELFMSVLNFDLYTRYLSIFGWNGKTKYYCFYMTLLNFGIYFVLVLLAHLNAIRLQTGQRQLREPEERTRVF